MQLLATLLAAATVGVALAQQTPQCALTCLAQLDTESGCQQTDIHCLCSSPAVPDAVPCVLNTCANEIEEVETFAGQICASAGVTIDVPALIAAATANSTAGHNATSPTHGQAHAGTSSNSSSSGSSGATPTHHAGAGVGSASNTSDNSTAPLPPTSAGVRDTAAGAFALTVLAVAAALVVL